MSFAEIKIKYWPKSLEDKRKTPIFALINKDKMNNGDQVERLPQEGECRNESESSLLARASAVAQGVLKEIEALGGNVEHSWSKEKMSASNIPLPGKSGSAKGNKSTGTTINSCTREYKAGWMDYKYSLLSSDDYEIIVKFE